MITNQEIIQHVIGKMLPESVKNFTSGLELLMGYHDTKFLEDLSDTYSQLDIEHISVNEVYELFDQHIIKLSHTLGIEFVDETNLSIIIPRLDYVSGIGKPEAEFEDSETYYASIFAEKFRTSIGRELLYLSNTDVLFEKQKELTDKYYIEDIMDNMGFVRAFGLFVGIIGETAIPDNLRNISTLHDMSIEFFKTDTYFTNVTEDQMALTILLVSLFDDMTLNISLNKRLEVFDQFINLIPEESVIRTNEKYIKLCERFHSLGGNR